ncbi:MAG: hypothetical protein M3065_16860 [Actinomycetota bacterium]|nr:hypothetical protein [Actinomycetota bacterium]
MSGFRRFAGPAARSLVMVSLGVLVVVPSTLAAGGGGGGGAGGGGGGGGVVAPPVPGTPAVPCAMMLIGVSPGLLNDVSSTDTISGTVTSCSTGPQTLHIDFVNSLGQANGNFAAFPVAPFTVQAGKKVGFSVQEPGLGGFVHSAIAYARLFNDQGVQLNPDPSAGDGSVSSPNVPAPSSQLLAISCCKLTLHNI